MSSSLEISPAAKLYQPIYRRRKQCFHDGMLTILQVLVKASSVTRETVNGGLNQGLSCTHFILSGRQEQEENHVTTSQKILHRVQQVITCLKTELP